MSKRGRPETQTERNAEIRRRAAAGETKRQIVASMDVRYSTVWRVLNLERDRAYMLARYHTRRRLRQLASQFAAAR